MTFHSPAAADFLALCREAELARRAWASSGELRASFGNDKSRFIAYRLAAVWPRSSPNHPHPAAAVTAATNPGDRK